MTQSETAVEMQHLSVAGRIRHRAMRGNTRGSVIMACLTLSITFFWIPNLLYFNVVSFSPEYYSQAADVITSNMLLIQSILDPIWFGIVLKDVRSAVRNIFIRHQ